MRHLYSRSSRASGMHRSITRIRHGSCSGEGRTRCRGRAFTEYMHTDSRIDVTALQQYMDPLPTEPGTQNALWYRWYREVEEDTRIRQVHREYLFTRDYAGIAALLAGSLGPLSFWQLESMTIAGFYGVALLAQYLVVRRAAYNHGVRFVTTVLASKASK